MRRFGIVFVLLSVLLLSATTSKAAMCHQECLDDADGVDLDFSQDFYTLDQLIIVRQTRATAMWNRYLALQVLIPDFFEEFVDVNSCNNAAVAQRADISLELGVAAMFLSDAYYAIFNGPHSTVESSLGHISDIVGDIPDAFDSADAELDGSTGSEYHMDLAEQILDEWEEEED